MLIKLVLSQGLCCHEWVIAGDLGQCFITAAEKSTRKSAYTHSLFHAVENRRNIGKQFNGFYTFFRV